MRETVTIYVPDGYENGQEFLEDNGFEPADYTPAWDHPSNRNYEPVERRAKALYAELEYDGPSGTTKPPWEEGGNGTKQDECRQIARRELAEETGKRPSP